MFVFSNVSFTISLNSVNNNKIMVDITIFAGNNEKQFIPLLELTGTDVKHNEHSLDCLISGSGTYHRILLQYISDERSRSPYWEKCGLKYLCLLRHVSYKA